MTNLLNEVKLKWEREQPIYEELAKVISDELVIELKHKGINARVTYRPKELASMLKKVIRKKYTCYEQLTDKAGVRIVVHFIKEMEVVEKIIISKFKVLEKYDKAADLGTTTLGYQAIHYIVGLQSIVGREYDQFKDKYVEIQLRTLCQDTWAEMSHILAYKTEISIPDQISRQIHCLSALFEVCDKNYADINKMICELPGTHSIKLLNILEKYFFSFVGYFYDRELSMLVIEHLSRIYNEEEINSFEKTMNDFVERYTSKLKLLFHMYRDKSIFITQPELIMILERLENNKYVLEEHWAQKYPIEELYIIATAWGKPLNS